MKIAIVDYGTGNPKSVFNMLNSIGIDAIISRDPQEIEYCDKLILPGVGAFDPGISKLMETGLLPALNDLVLIKGRPILGICLGMQLMCRRSEEGVLPGLGWINAEVLKFSSCTAKRLRVPHMGWNVVHKRKNNVLLDPLEQEEKYYFVHSYYVHCNDSKDILTETDYGSMFVSSFQKENIVGVQFHPEKSHRFGLRILKRFAEDFN